MLEQICLKSTNNSIKYIIKILSIFIIIESFKMLNLLDI